jgi:hypothetical protein
VDDIQRDVAWLDYEQQTLPTDDMVSLKFALKNLIHNAQGLLRRVEDHLHSERKQHPVHGEPERARAMRYSGGR